MGIKFEIIFEENPNGMYFTGQVVKGRAIIHVEEDTPFKGIQLRVRGHAKVRWNEGSGDNTDVHSDEIKYFDSVTECIDTKGSEQTLNPGSYTYTFECAIPSQCPSSFEGVFGRIRYEAKIIVIRPRAFNRSYSMGFSVLKIFDLNQFPELRVPANLEEFKHFCCGPCRSRPLILSLEIQRTSFVPGEFIQFKARLLNKSSTKIEHVRVALNLVAMYSVRNRVRQKMEKIAIAKKRYGGFHKDLLEFQENIQVPPTPPTCDGICQIVKLTYEVALTAGVQGAHINPYIVIPVIIGNIPYVQKSSNISEDNLITNLTNGISPIRNTSSEYSPPSYEEAAFMRSFQTTMVGLEEKTKTDKVIEKFTPRYTFYGKTLYDIENNEENTKEIL